MSPRRSEKRRIRRAYSRGHAVYSGEQFKRLPFYEILAILLQPTRLKTNGRGSTHNTSLPFQFLPHHVNDILKSLTRNTASMWTEFGAEVHLRFCLFDRYEQQDDSYPYDLRLEVNNQPLALPESIPVHSSGGLSGRIRLPINILPACYLDASVKNKVSVSWRPELDREYVAGLFLVRKKSVATILHELRQRRMQSATLTKALVKKKVQRQASCDDIAVTSLHISLTCPLSKKRMSVPCRAEECKHLQCFDAPSYLQVNETRPTWTCPVCGKRAPFSSLVVDQLFVRIVAEAPGNCDSVVFREDGSWAPSASQEELSDRGNSAAATPSSSTASRSKRHSASLSSDQVGRASKRRKEKVVDLTVDVIDLTEHSNSEEADGGCAGVCLRPEHASAGHGPGETLSTSPPTLLPPPPPPPRIISDDVYSAPDFGEATNGAGIKFDLRRIIL
ncbi:E3 SUMO-protein ligase PIAS1-like [Dermacentor andersoni]|uniref:E3 SUMO-protein ligase PIAS1-like n=1 Tax=Dermacentor andersoni TaxID=34620 RepID=UPI003B3A38C5